MRKYLTVFIFILSVLKPGSGEDVFAQNADVKFGKNRIQYKSFNWSFLSSENFDVYFYEGGRPAARESITFLEEEFDRITDLIGYPPYTKIKIFLYNNVADMQQSNVGLNEVIYSPGGETKFVKEHVEVAHPGTLSELRKELVEKVTDILINEMMYGGSLSEMFQSAILLHLPEWFINGVSSYVAHGWSQEMDTYTRDFIQNNKKAQKVGRLTGDEATIIGHSIWNYIVEKYGRNNISNILNYTRITRNEERSINVTLGITFKKLLEDWQLFYSQLSTSIDEHYIPIKAENAIFSNPKGGIITSLSLSPDGTRMAYVLNRRGKYEVNYLDLESGATKNVLKGGVKAIQQEVNYSMPLIDWADEKTLGIVFTRAGKNLFWMYDINTNSKISSVLDRFHQVHDFSFSSNGRLAVFSAETMGQNNLYLISTRRMLIRKLTDDHFDNINGRFIPNTNIIVFSSNRNNDSLKIKDRPSLSEISPFYNLYAYNLDTTNLVLARLTNTLSRDIKPQPVSENEIYYLSDQKGINNLYKYSVSQNTFIQLTNFNTTITDYDLDRNMDRLFLVGQKKGNPMIFEERDVNFKKQVFTPPVRRQEIAQVRYLRKLKETQAKSEQVERKPEPEPEPEPVVEKEPETYKGEIIINTENYTFESIPQGTRRERGSFLTQYRQLQKKSTIYGPLPYETMFRADNVVTSWVIDPIRGFGLLLETRMTDLLENHRFSGGIMSTLDFRNGDIFAEYEYLKSFLDYKVKVDRRVYLLNVPQEGWPYRYSLNKIEAGVSIPFGMYSRLSINPFFANTIFNSLNPDSPNSSNFTFEEGVQENFLGINTELVYDNTLPLGMNIIQGTRAKVVFQNQEGIGSTQRGFSKITADVRHYQEIHRELVFAVRGFYGKFFGSNPQNFMVGGVDNWLFNRLNREGPGNPLRLEPGFNQDLLFSEFVTSVRGYELAEFFGNNVMLLNAELRLPLVRYFSAGPISSNFFRNFQITGFYDIGSAWTGPFPFSEDNTITDRIITQDPFVVELRDFRNPWLISYGLGFRSVVLGFYLKLDLAWLHENEDQRSPRLVASFGFDF